MSVGRENRLTGAKVGALVRFPQRTPPKNAIVPPKNVFYVPVCYLCFAAAVIKRPDKTTKTMRIYLFSC